MQSSSISIANRSIGEWISSLPTLVLLILTIFLSSGEILHSQLLKIGQNTWDGYFELRGEGFIGKPTCDQNPDIDSMLAAAVAEKRAEMEADPLASIFGVEVDENAVRQSLEAAANNCRQEWATFEEIQANITPGVRAYRTVEIGVSKLVTKLGEFKHLLLCLLILICAATATLSRHHIALRPATTKKDHFVSAVAQLTANSLLLMSAVVYRHFEQQSMDQGVQVHNFYLHYFWIAGFALLTAISLFQVVKQPSDAEEGGSWAKTGLTIPLYSFMSLSAGFQFVSQGYYQGISVYLGMMMEHSTMFLNLALYIWIGMLLKQTRLAHLAFGIFRPWNMSPELLCFAVLFFAALPTAYTGASGIFVIAAGATIYAELTRAGANKQLALAATAMSGSMGVVLKPCLLVVIIAALNNSVTTTELFTSGLKIFLISIGLFFIFSQLYRKEPSRIAPPSEAVPKSLKALAPLLPYIIILYTVIAFFSDLMDRRLDEFSAPIILPVILIAILMFEKFNRHVLSASIALLSLITIASLYSCAVTAWGLPGIPGASGIDEAFLSDTVWRNILFVGVIYLCLRYGHMESEEEEEVREGVSHKLEGALRLATNETTGHIGALLMLMALSVSVGGIIERSGMMELLPEQFSSVWVAMSLLVVVMVGIGMIMDPYGAVILVNATIAQVAINNGIDPLHFWMITLVAFELGYLTPPVALNHLLTRQVVGDAEVQSAVRTTGSFWHRYEKFLLPVATMLTALLIVSFLPLMSDTIHDFLFVKFAIGQ